MGMTPDKSVLTQSSEKQKPNLPGCAWVALKRYCHWLKCVIRHRPDRFMNPAHPKGLGRIDLCRLYTALCSKFKQKPCQRHKFLTLSQ
jgi:hypothetical protein